MRSFLFPLVALFLGGLAFAQEVPRPNVVLIMTDDQGWGDLGIHGNTALDTPRIDALARESASMERFYVSPVCTPTRAALMTGRNSIRTQAIDTYRGRAMMSPDEVTLAEVLRADGYATGLFGKWHLGDNYPLRPQDQGFDEVIFHRGGGLAQPADHLDNNRRYTDAYLYHNGKAVQTKGFCMDVYVDYAVAFMKESVQAKKPFFAYVATNTPHGPYHDIPMDLYEKYKARDLSVIHDNEKQLDGTARIFAMIENVDQNVGRLLDTLDELGVAEDTIVIYMHDNGPNQMRYVGPFRGMKSNIHEGGIRSPFYVRYPRTVPAGNKRGEPAAHYDVLPTIVEATGADLPERKLDGISLWGALTNKTDRLPDRYIHIQAHRGDKRFVDHHFAIIGPRYKLLRNSGFGNEQLPERMPGLELYDLIADPGERVNLIGDKPMLATELFNARRTWFADATNYEAWGLPPAIEIDFSVEPYHELNRNDWRATAHGYGRTGMYRIATKQDVAVELSFFTRSKAKNESGRIVVKLNDKVVADQDLTHTKGERITVHLDQSLRFEAGTHWLELELFDGEEHHSIEHVHIKPST